MCIHFPHVETVEETLSEYLISNTGQWQRWDKNSGLKTPGPCFNLSHQPWVPTGEPHGLLALR
jgi:hypothetical protein